jgi:HAD superfamily hydrolase (TIGR01549 family)
MTLKAVLFDLDMTLVDSSALDDWRRHRFWTHVMANLGQVKPFAFSSASAHDLPARLRAMGLKVGIVTSSPRHYAEAILKMFSIDCDVLVAYDDTEQHKPDPGPITKALEHLGVHAGEAVHVGDAAIDVEASFHAGVYSIGAGWGVQNFHALSSAAPDALFMKPSTLLKLDELGRRGYLAESHALGVEPKVHAGSFLRCGGTPEKYALGRYFQREDSRHATGKLSNLLLEFKSSDGPAPTLAKALVGFVGRLDWTPDYIVSVPPKPSQERNRFSSVFDAVEDQLSDDTHVLRDGLRCVKEVDGYKGMGRMERAEAIRGAFASKYTWESGRVLLLDDVLTTGETVGECARVLLANAAAEVRIVTLGRDQQVFARKLCPACTRPMRVRTNGTTGAKFWGCSGYPDHCANTEDM